MSIKSISRVWEKSEQKGSSLLCLLAIADFADDNGFAWPAISTIAEKIRMSTRHTSRILQSLAESREICIVNRKANMSNLYIVTVGLSFESFEASAKRAKEFGGKDDILSWWEQGDNLSGEGDKMSYEGDNLSGEDDIAMSSDPSLTVNEPSENPPPSEKPKTEPERDYLSDLARFNSKKEKRSNSRPPGWERVGAPEMRICETVARLFNKRMPVIKARYNTVTAERQAKQIDLWSGGATMILERFETEQKAIDAIVEYESGFDGGITIAGPQSLVNQLEINKRHNGNGHISERPPAKEVFR